MIIYIGFRVYILGGIHRDDVNENGDYNLRFAV